MCAQFCAWSKLFLGWLEPPHLWYDRILKRQPWTQQVFVDESKLIYALDE